MSQFLSESIRNRVKRSIRKQKLTKYPNSRFDSSDIAQEVSLQIWKEIEENDLVDLFLSDAYLDTMTRGHVSKLQRFHLAAKRSMDKESSENASCASQAPSPSAIVSNRDEVEKVLHALCKLDDLEKKIIRRRFFEGAEFQEIANELDETPQRVRRKYVKIIHKIKLLMS